MPENNSTWHDCCYALLAQFLRAFRDF